MEPRVYSDSTSSSSARTLSASKRTGDSLLSTRVHVLGRPGFTRGDSGAQISTAILRVLRARLWLEHDT